MLDLIVSVFQPLRNLRGSGIHDAPTTKFQQNRAMHRRVIKVSTQFVFQWAKNGRPNYAKFWGS